MTDIRTKTIAQLPIAPSVSSVDRILVWQDNVLKQSSPNNLLTLSVPVVTSTTNGLMLSADKVKLDQLEVVFDSIASLRANSVVFATNSTSYVKAYLAGDTLGGGVFIRIVGSASDDGGNIIVDAIGQRWKRAVDWPITVTNFGGSILAAATAGREVWLERDATYSLASTLNLSGLTGRVIYLNGATITGSVGFTGTHLLSISGDTRIVGPGTFNGANVPAPSGAYTAGVYSGVGVFITGTGDQGSITNVRFTNFQSGPILADSATTRNLFGVYRCTFDDVQKYTSAETNAVVHYNNINYGVMEDCYVTTYNFKGFYNANSTHTQMVRCHSSGGVIGHASHYLTGGADCKILDCSHTGVGFGIKCFQTARPVVQNFAAPSAYSAVFVQGCSNFIIDGVEAPSPTVAPVYVEGINGFPTSGLVNNIRSRRAAAGTTSDHVGVRIAGSGTGTIDAVRITNSYFENMLWGVIVANTGVAQTNIEIVGNEFRNTGQYGVIGYIGSASITDNLIEMDNAGVEAAVFINRDGVTTTGVIDISRNRLRGCNADNIQIGEGGRLAYKAIIINDNNCVGGARFLDYRGDANAADVVSYLEIKGNCATDLTTNGSTLLFNTTTSTRLRNENNVFLNASFVPVADTYTNLTNLSVVGTITHSGSPETVFAAPVGTQFRRTDGGAATSFYVKESGTGNTGWVGK